MKINKKELLSIPNIMGYFRLCLIPVFVTLYLNAKTPHDYMIVALVVGISGISDFLDGFVARHFNQVTEFGKFLDPVADKISLGFLVFCLCTRFNLLTIAAILYVVKEGFMAVMGIIILKKNGHKLDGAKWFGKVCTFYTYVVMFILLLWFDIPTNIANILIIIDIAWMIFTFIMYVPVFMKMYHQEKVPA